MDVPCDTDMYMWEHDRLSLGVNPSHLSQVLGLAASQSFL